MSDAQTSPDAYAIVLADLYKQRSAIDTAIQAIEALRRPNARMQPVAVLHQPVATASEYLGLSIAEAAKKLLSERLATLSSTEIADGLKAVGYPMNAADPGNVVGSVLSRRFESVGDVVRVSRGQWGLPEWYPTRDFRKKEAGETPPADVESAIDEMLEAPKSRAAEVIEKLSEMGR